MKMQQCVENHHAERHYTFLSVEIALSVLSIRTRNKVTFALSNKLSRSGQDRFLF